MPIEGLTGTYRARWEDCRLEDVTFTNLDCARFIRCAFRSVDMSEANLHDVSLHDIREGRIALPDRPDNFAIDDKLFLEVEPVLRSKLNPEAARKYRSEAKLLSRFGSPFTVHPRTFDTLLEELAPSDRATVMATLYEMRQGRPIWPPASTAR